MNRPKVFALYLPQFHETEENNEWWGKGFTDWQAVKAAKPVYKGHKQPRVPLHQNYYDLSDVEAIRAQARMAKEHGVSGFCIYHYYSNGQLMLQKPAELLQQQEDIDIEYFFSWGNHDFRKSWFNGDHHLLREQTYGGKEDFARHYAYLSRFFKDKRYLKIDNKPVFAIYQVSAITDYDTMIEVWNELLKKDGFDGLYVVAMKCQPTVKSSDLMAYNSVEAVMPFEPMNVRSNAANGSLAYIYLRRLRTVFLRYYNKVAKHAIPEKFDYTWANEMMLKSRGDTKQFYCIFPGWDNTPRYQGKGAVFTGATPELFYKYAKKFMERSAREQAELLFVNAWNEWGETAYLEPDEEHQFAYLEALQQAIADCDPIR